MSDIDQLKRTAALRAAEWIRDGMVLGLGTGSTVYFLLEEIAAQRSRGAWKELVGIPTSEATTRVAKRFGIPLATLDERPRIDLTIDGADEVDDELRLIKGLGGALLREKIVAQASETVVIVVDRSKRVKLLGTHAPLPVEVDPFGAHTHDDFFTSMGGRPVFRSGPDRGLVRTDGGHLLIDVRFPDGIRDPAALEARVNNRPGIVENGLFIDLAHHVITASSSAVEVDSLAAARR
ncbi:MAG: ribose-5-phosphate isomerase RpiA [Gemmatimonadetes bacterium]|nr:ribose-5-phosphate isomerase RpiA [Gemmatimonadota bacterium]